MRHLYFIILCVSLCLLNQNKAKASEPALQSLQQSVQILQDNMRSLQQTVQSQNEIIRDQAARLQELEQRKGAAPGTVIPGPQAEQGKLAAGAAKISGLAQGFNPDMGVTSVIQGNLTEKSEDEEGNDTIALKELELSFAQYVDPYSRLDAIIAFNDNLEEQNVDIEEAYYSHWGLPFGFRGQAGKFRSKIGKQNLQHLHALETADYAMVIRDFFGEEGLSSSGVRLVHDIPNPWDLPVEISGEVLRGNNGASFSGVSRRPIFNTHAKTFVETSENTNVEFGWTTLFGDENPPQFAGLDENGEDVNAAAPDGRAKYGVKVYGADVTFNWLLPENRTFKLQNEVYFQNRGSLVHPNTDPWGFYSLADFRFHPRFSTGVRFDYLEPLDVTGDHRRSTGVSPYLTFWQSEFANFRVQYSHTEPASASERSDNAVYVTANVLIGSHKHPVQ
jgi:hypothetical protein